MNNNVIYKLFCSSDVLDTYPHSFHGSLVSFRSVGWCLRQKIKVSCQKEYPVMCIFLNSNIGLLDLILDK